MTLELCSAVDSSVQYIVQCAVFSAVQCSAVQCSVVQTGVHKARLTSRRPGTAQFVAITFDVGRLHAHIMPI